MNERNDLAEKLELIGKFLMIDGLTNIISQYKPDMNIQQMNGLTLQILSKGMAANKPLMDELTAHHMGITTEAVQELSDNEYTKALRDTIWSDVFGFFA